MTGRFSDWCWLVFHRWKDIYCVTRVIREVSLEVEGARVGLGSFNFAHF